MYGPKITIPQKPLRRFCAQYRIRRLALFGSVLRDDFGPESDIDILVLFEPGAKVSFLTLGRMQRSFRPCSIAGLTWCHKRRSEAGYSRRAVLASAQEVYATCRSFIFQISITSRDT